MDAGDVWIANSASFLDNLLEGHERPFQSSDVVCGHVAVAVGICGVTSSWEIREEQALEKAHQEYLDSDCELFTL